MGPKSYQSLAGRSPEFPYIAKRIVLWLAKDQGAMALDIRIRFGRAIRHVRQEQKFNQEEAAERCGLHRTYYSGVERGVRNVSLVNIEKIARGLKRSLPELFSRV
jgi:DNA-binding XRE family transcriptional regulator